MFKIRSSSVLTQKTRVQSIKKKLPEAHNYANSAALDHLHRQATQAAKLSGLDSSPVKVFKNSYVGINRTEAGDKLADVEYGTPEQQPNPVLRNAISVAKPQAQIIYNSVLKKKAGL